MHNSLKMWISGGATLLLLQMLTLIAAQGDQDFKHELPPGVELVNPKDFGLTEDQLGGLLSNVKVLGGSQVGDTKTQILTVGFQGDEDLNFDDFDIPGLTDRKPADIPDKEKEIASVAFEKFKEFFKDPKKSAKTYEPPKTGDAEPRIISGNKPAPSPQVSYAPEQKDNRNNPPQAPRIQNNSPRQYHELVRPSPESLQQHYPVQLTQPLNVPTTSLTVPTPTRNPIHTRPQNQQHQNFNQNENLNNHRTHHTSHENSPQYQTAPPPSQPPLRHSSHAIAFTNNNQPSTQEFGAKVPPTTHVPYVVTQPQPQNQGHKQYTPNQNQVSQQEEKVQGDQYQPPYNSLPPGNFQRFNFYPQNKSPPTSSPQPPRTTQEVGQVVRNQLLFTNNNNQNSYQSPPQNQHQPQHTQRPQEIQGVVPPHEDPQEYRTITQTQYPLPPPPSYQNPSPSSSSSVSSFLEKFPPTDPQQRPVSHVFIQQGKQGSPIRQTSFHPRFQPPTHFAHDFTPSVNQITTPTPYFEVTPSMPMILISTNENAITDPRRMELLRQQQRAMEEKRVRQQRQQEEVSKERQPHSLNYNKKQPVRQTTHYNNSPPLNQITEAPRQQQQQQTYSPQNTFTESMYRQYNRNNNQNQQRYPAQQQNSFNFQTQQQQHQLHKLQQNSYYNRQTHPNPPSIPPRPYYEQQQQPSTNYPAIPIGIPVPPPPRFQLRPEPHHQQYYATRHKRGYRHRLSSILRGILGDRDY